MRILSRTQSNCVHMPTLNDITGIPSEAIELLEAVGYLEVSDLREADVGDLGDELAKANKILDLLPNNPTSATIEKWQKLAAQHEASPTAQATEEKFDGREANKRGSMAQETGMSPSKGLKATSPEIVNLEEDEDMMEMLGLSPVAEPLDDILMTEQGVSIDDVSDGVLLNQCESDVKINIMTTLGKADSMFRKDEVVRVGLNSSKVRNFDDLDSSVQYVQPLERAPLKELVATSEELNQGVDSSSRKFIKGVFHPHKKTLCFAASAAILFVAILAVNIVSLLGLFVYRAGLSASTVMVWVIGSLFLLLTSAAAYLYFGTRARCVVCRQPPLLPKKCTKHKKAHHVKGIGYIVPTALQLLVYKWFYCTYCGTALRLKK